MQIDEIIIKIKWVIFKALYFRELDDIYDLREDTISRMRTEKKEALGYYVGIRSGIDQILNRLSRV